MAAEPRVGVGRLYHIDLARKDVGRVAILPGDPDRVPRIAKRLRRAKRLSSHREYLSYGGFIDDEYVLAMSTGIGGPSVAIAIEELARLGVRVMIRVGTCGAIDRSVRVGSLLVAEAAVRLDGTTRQYVMEGYPAAATPEVSVALKEAARALGKICKAGVVASTDSFYVGQGRLGFKGYLPSHANSLTEDLRKANVLCFEMESSTLFTLGRIFDVKTGAIFAAIANRVTDQFSPGAGIEDSIKVTIEAIRRMARAKQL